MSRISLSEDGRIVIVRMQGEVTRESAAALLPATVDAAQRLPAGQPPLFLIDVRGGRNVGSGMSNYMFAKEDFARFPLLQRARIAVVTDVVDMSHDFVRASVESAGYSVSLFMLEEDAVQWLLSDIPRIEAE